MKTLNKVLTSQVLSLLRILKAKNPGDNYYDEYIRHYTREGEDFYDQYHFAIQRVVDHSPKRILEIGVRTGLSICNMLNAYTKYDGIEQIDLCDIWGDGYASPEIVKMNLRAINIPQELIDKINFIVGDSQKEIPELQGTYDYILVDGDHSKEVAFKDLENVVRLCAKDGVIVFDDISEHGCNLLDVWEQFKATYYGQLFETGENLKGKGTAWAIKRV